jgi:hypothetical protein
MKKPKPRRVSDPNYVLRDHWPLNGPETFIITRNDKKRYSGVIINESHTATITVQIESSFGYYAPWRTLGPGGSIELRDFPLSNISFNGKSEISVMVWSTERAPGFVRTSPPALVTVLGGDINVAQWGGTPVTGRDITGDIDNLQNLDVALSTRASQATAASILGQLDVLLSTRARLQPWYQPNFDSVKQHYTQDGKGPHGFSNRTTYTVPANRIAIVSASSGSILRTTLSAVPGIAEVSLWDDDLHPILRVMKMNGTVGDGGDQAVGWGDTLKAGDVVKSYTRDLSTGGDYSYSIGVVFTEFDT